MLTRMGQLVSLSVIGLVAAGCAALDSTESGDGYLFERLGAGQSAVDVPEDADSSETGAAEPQADLFVMGRNFLGRLTQPQEAEEGAEPTGFSLVDWAIYSVKIAMPTPKMIRVSVRPVDATSRRKILTHKLLCNRVREAARRWQAMRRPRYRLMNH